MRVATRTNDQLKKLHVILRELGIDKEAKAEMIFAVTNGESRSAGDLNFMEAKELIDKLQKELNKVKHTPGPSHSDSNREGKVYSPEELSKQKMRRAILSRCYTLRWTDNDGVDYDKLNNFLLTHGAVKKKLNDLEHDDLVKVVTQFNTMDLNQYK